MITNISPIALFCFKRLHHLKRVINALKANSLSKASNLYIFSDASRNSEDRLDVEKVRYLISKAA